MKKILSFMLCICLMIGVIAVSSLPASAASAALSSSSSTVYRGESVTLYVSLYNDQAVSNGGIVLNYDTSVFEFTGGSCNVSGAALAQVNPANRGGVFAMQEDTVVSGTIFTFNLKVRSDAPFGTYGISGSWSLNTGSGSCSATVTVACEHNYGPANKIDLVNHQSVCTYCGEVKNEPHNFGSGEIIKESTCKEMGLKRFTCSACGQIKEEETPVNNNHKFSSWTKADENKHTHSCSVCGKKETASHNWNSGTIIKNANCKVKGGRKKIHVFCVRGIGEKYCLMWHKRLVAIRLR